MSSLSIVEAPCSLLSQRGILRTLCGLVPRGHAAARTAGTGSRFSPNHPGGTSRVQTALPLPLPGPPAAAHEPHPGPVSQGHGLITVLPQGHRHDPGPALTSARLPHITRGVISSARHSHISAMRHSSVRHNGLWLQMSGRPGTLAPETPGTQKGFQC